MKPNVKALIYTILADDKPVAVLEASAAEVRDLIKKRWLVAELATLKVDGQPLYRRGTRLRVRPAFEEEWIIYDEECSMSEDPEEPLFVYLVAFEE